MLKIGFATLITLVTGGLINHTEQARYDADSTQQPITQKMGDSYQLSTPDKQGRFLRLQTLDIQRHQVILYPQDDAPLHITSDLIQWVSSVHTAQQGQRCITLHLEAENRWHLLTLRLSRTRMLLLMNWLKRRLPAERLHIGQLPDIRPQSYKARIITESWQGTITPGADVTLYLIPPLLIVLRDGQVTAKLATRSIRRVLAVESGHNTFESLWQRHPGDGIIRLYALRETAVFLAARHARLAEAIAGAADCPLDTIHRDDKRQKL